MRSRTICVVKQLAKKRSSHNGFSQRHVVQTSATSVTEPTPTKICLHLQRNTSTLPPKVTMKVHQNLSHFLNPRKTSKSSKPTEESRIGQERSVINKDTGNRPSKRRKSTIEEEDSVEHPESSDGRNKANVAEERMKRAIQEAEGEDQGPLLVTMKNTLMKRTILPLLHADHTIPEANRLKTMRKPQCTA